MPVCASRPNTGQRPVDADTHPQVVSRKIQLRGGKNEASVLDLGPRFPGMVEHNPGEVSTEIESVGSAWFTSGVSSSRSLFKRLGGVQTEEKKYVGEEQPFRRRRGALGEPRRSRPKRTQSSTGYNPCMPARPAPSPAITTPDYRLLLSLARSRYLSPLSLSRSLAHPLSASPPITVPCYPHRFRV